MLVLGVDFETTGLDLKKDRITEVGAVLWETDDHQPVQVINALVQDGSYPPLTDEIVELTGITQSMLNGFSVTPSTAFSELIAVAERAQMIVAHNGTEFDRPMLDAEMERQGRKFPALPWVDTCVDIPYPKRVATRKLTHLAAEHGFFNPFAHRAVFDVLTMLKVMSCYPFTEVKRYSESPMVRLRADVDYARREEAKTRGYRWNGERKWWVKNIKQFQLEEEVKSVPFKVIVLEGKP